MSKRITVGKKFKSSLREIISSTLDLSDTTELNEIQYEQLFKDPPSQWSDLENALCDYLCRKQLELQDRIINELCS